jgi:protein-glutamine gamma-glutamyltransferase
VKSHEINRTTFAWCAAAASAAQLPLAVSLPAWLLGLLAFLTLGGAALGWRGIRLHALVRLPLTLGAAGMVLYAYGFRFGRDTGGALLTTMLALKLLELRHARDARSLLGFALFAVMAGFLQSQAPGVMLLALLAVVLLVAAMARVTQAELAVPAAHFPATPRRGLVSALRLVALSVPLAAAAFLFFPRLGSPLWGLPENAADARTGLSDDMSPGDIANLYADDSPAFRVTFTGREPDRDQRYWRGPVLTLFDGRRWSRDGFDMWNRSAAPLEPQGEPLDYVITLEPTDRRYLVALDLPETAAPETRLLSDRSLLTMRRAVSELLQYRMRSYAGYRFEPELGPRQRQSTTMLPGSSNPRTRALVESWRAAGAGDEEVIRRALENFRANFTYTLNPQLLGRHSVDDFLFETRQGYCEHFASAFAVMMRAADIPARIVTGYLGGAPNLIGGYWVVRQSDAHAWTEVWLAGEGWVRIDPTSAVSPERIERGTGSIESSSSGWGRYADTLLQAGDWLRRSWNDVVLGFNAARQRNLLEQFGIPEASTTQLAIALVIFVGLALAATLALLLRAPRASPDPVVRAWRRFLRRLERAGIAKPPHEGPVAFGERAAAALPAAAQQLATLSQRYARRRYAGGSVEPGADAALCDDLRQFRVPSHKRQRSSP